MNIKHFFAKGLLALALSLPAPNAAAQQEDYTPLPAPYDFLGIKDFKVWTQMVQDGDSYQNWNGEGLHTGIERIELTVFNHSEIDHTVPQPENPMLISELFDTSGRAVVSDTTNTASIFKKFRFSKNLAVSTSCGFTILRGGEYGLKVEMTPGLFNRQETIVYADEPGMHQLTPNCDVDSIAPPLLYITSGYPYDYASFSGKKTLHWTVALDNEPENVLREGDAAFELLTDLPTLAAVDSVFLDEEIDKPGKYRYTVTSDFAPANGVFTFKISDVLDPEVTMDKTVYTAGQSSEATVTVNLSYGYPYVGKDSSYGEPTVEVCAEIMGQETTVKYSDEAWADSDMHCTAQLKVPLDKVTDAVVKEYEGKVPMKLTIKFNGQARLECNELIPFDADASVGTIVGDRDKGPVKYFNALGIEVDESYRGFVITSDGRKVVR